MRLRRTKQREQRLAGFAVPTDVRMRKDKPRATVNVQVGFVVHGRIAFDLRMR